MAVTTFTTTNTLTPTYGIYRYNLPGRSARIIQFIAAVQNPHVANLPPFPGKTQRSKTNSAKLVNQSRTISTLMADSLVSVVDRLRQRGYRIFQYWGGSNRHESAIVPLL